ncbi:monosaccharide ABC transporter ATP-binding protein (CUT2 family) [Halanaerobium saccharolyticum]|uniref:Monosaccharide ABC transporter ATP-binding protein (CUT2 family) n=1 Tax=Halanaerobium saccharolyticum TaxID=43595 RepID=A0A4R6M0L4_9FIRM|nr:sugar ABC transporter ATP-binding protein [Halanaerobium saccharolyticum]TDO93860.1 monosaccharide ABC transporter ATP-binding protein (CUT2 family) [Halanaerobium saccharolyticum]
MDNILEIKNVTKEFPGVLALDNVSFNIRRGEVHVLIGENGAGKSTLMKILSGVYQANSGKVLLNGDEIDFSNPKEAQLAGISIIYQEFSLIPYLNAVENIFLGREYKKNGVLDKKRMTEEAKDLLDTFEVEIDLEKSVNQLSVAEQQFIEIAKAVSINDNVLILDEPTATLTNQETEILFNLIRNLKEKGVTMIFISHHLEEAFEIGDRLTCLRDGKWVGTENISDLSEKKIIKMMVGRDIGDTFPDREGKYQKEIMIEVNDLKRNEKEEFINFKVRKGEILGVAGLVGSGRTEMARALIGADKVLSKEIYINGKKVEINSPSDALDNGIGLIPENRKSQGLILGLSVKDNISINSLDKILKSNLFINKKEEKKRSQKLVEDLNIKTPSLKQTVKNLSGGNQQKVVLAKWLGTDSNVLIFDEPTRGIDVGAKLEIYKLMNELVDMGISIIMISSELPEVLAISDRIMIMHKNKINAVLDNNEDVDQETIMYYATGGEQYDRAT